MIKRALYTTEVGHAGTLDPLAHGLLVVAVGKATRLVRFVQDARKVYRTCVRFHSSSATLDAEGPFAPVVNPPEVTREAVLRALTELEGEHDQMPPAFSAKRVEGQRAYDLARMGIEPKLTPKQVTAWRLSLLEADPPMPATPGGLQRVTLECEVSSGYYVRSLGRDLAHRLGTEGYLETLERVSIGAFHRAEAISSSRLEAKEGRSLEEIGEELRGRVVSPWLALAELPQITVEPEVLRDLRHGKQPKAPDALVEIVASHGGDQVVLRDRVGQPQAVVRVDAIMHRLQTDLDLAALGQALCNKSDGDLE
jgi:tRNA pseudouridine55 synthase